MPNNTNAQVIAFCNTDLRPAADVVIQAYNTLKRLKQIWDGQSMVSLIPNDANLVQDGATVASGTADGRAPITDAQVNTFISNLVTITNLFEANTNLILNQCLQVAVNGQSRI